MYLYILKRVLSTIPVVVIVVLFVFLMLRLAPGDPAAVIAGDYATAEDVERIREQLGLNDAIPVQMYRWIAQLGSGDLGTAIFSKLPVTTLIGQRLEPTLLLSLTTIVFTVLIAVPLGTLAAYKAGSWIDRFVMLFSVAGFSVPVFVLGYILIYVLAMQLQILPVQGYKSPFEHGFWVFLRHMVLPTMTLSVIYIALIARMTRASMTEVMTAQYIRTARLKGVSFRNIVIKHALRNALIAPFTVIMLQFPWLLTGVVIVETLFNYKGFGWTLIQAAGNNDIELLLACSIVAVLVVLVTQLISDIGYVFLNPKIRVS